MKRTPIIYLFIIGVILVNIGKIGWNALHENEDGPSEVFSMSSSEAERSGILISKLAVESDSNSNIAIAEAWIELCAVHRYSFIWFHRREPTGGFVVIIKLKDRVSPEVTLWPHHARGSYGYSSGFRYYLFSNYDDEPDFPMTLHEFVGNKQTATLLLKKSN